MFRPIGWAMITALFAYSAMSCTSRGEVGKAPTSQPVVIVELFTSEGCSSCPPADAVLADLSKPNAVDGVQIIPLGFHVDYWNQLGWKDRFSSADFSDRQQHYASLFHSEQVYTPQMVVDGTQEFVGSDKQKALASITRAAAETKGTIRIDLTNDPEDSTRIACKIWVNGIQRTGTDAIDIMLAITEDDLSTEVPSGENAGHTLHHTAVVRSLQRLASINAADTLPFSTSTQIMLQSEWRANRLHVVAFAQNSQSGNILAGGSQQIMTNLPIK